MAGGAAGGSGGLTGRDWPLAGVHSYKAAHSRACCARTRTQVVPHGHPQAPGLASGAHGARGGAGGCVALVVVHVGGRSAAPLLLPSLLLHLRSTLGSVARG